MNRNFKTSSITESAMITGILVILAYLSNFFSLVMFFYPTPAIILAKRKGLKYAALSLMASDILVSMLLGIQTGMIFLILYTPLAIALAYGVCKDEDANKTILYGSAAYMVSFVVLILLMNAVMGVNFVQQMTEMYDESINIMKEMVSNMPAGTNTAGTEQMIKTFDDMGKTMNFIITNVFPAILVVASVVTSYINYLVASKFAKRFSISIRQHEGLSYFSFPRTFMAAMAALLILSFVLNLFNINVSLIQVNLFMIVFAAMFFQGFAVLKFFLMRSSINKTLRTIILAMVLLMSGGFAQMLAIVGLVDLAIDLRKIK
ncbi:hypothetical protein SDC9_77133 [bioreactor metagenome]|jgi:uncharacterized protein YybS (DUF2232 family)|uniref:Uncharacterized protein YybS (DUF2232 family) n=2 Tax=root TaxID=1 RepID=A0A562JKZ4_9FIRM|nr:DUF2232 domain-containing protein [Sedimentibacter saalensis]TWH83545.1 uncharacterized protein YybS (DUF2232 family) [Sedimentibacter saalensis]